MAYTLCDKYGDCKPIRIIVPNVSGEPEVKAEFTPIWWVCDPCNRADQRYEVTYRADQEKPQYFRWYEVVTSDDTDSDIAIKVEHYRQVLSAQAAVTTAELILRRLKGTGTS